MITARLHLHRTIPLKGLNPNLYRYNKINSLAISRDWSLIATASDDGIVRLWRGATGELIKSFHSHTYCVTTVAISPDNKLLVSAGHNDAVRLWDISKGTEIYTIIIPDVSEEVGCSVSGLGFSPDGSLLATADSGGHNVMLWEVNSWKLRQTFSGHRDIVWKAIFSLDGKLLASCSGFADKTVKLWDIATGKEIASLEGHLQSVPSISFSNNCKRLASAGSDDCIRIWDLDAMHEIAILNHNDVGEVAFLANGSLMVSCSTTGELKLWNMENCQELQNVNGRLYCIHSIAVSSDGQSFILGYAEGIVEQWHVTDHSAGKSGEKKCGTRSV